MLPDELELICIGIEMHTSSINEVQSFGVGSQLMALLTDSYWPTTLGRTSWLPKLERTAEGKRSCSLLQNRERSSLVWMMGSKSISN